MMYRLALFILFAVFSIVIAPAFTRSAEPPQDASAGTPAGTPAGTSARPVDQDEADEETEDRPTSVWMEKKLKHSQAILRGLAMGDFEDVKYNAGRLKLLNRVEGFVRRKNPDYRNHLNTFSRVSAEIERQAEKENIEGATLAFNQLTVSCVECHKSLRTHEEEN